MADKERSDDGSRQPTGRVIEALAPNLTGRSRSGLECPGSSDHTATAAKLQAAPGQQIRVRDCSG